MTIRRLLVCLTALLLLPAALPEAQARSRLSKRAAKRHAKRMDRIFARWNGIGRLIKREWERGKRPSKRLERALKALRAKRAYFKRHRRSLTRGGCNIPYIVRRMNKTIGYFERVIGAMRKRLHANIRAASPQGPVPVEVLLRRQAGLHQTPARSDQLSQGPVAEISPVPPVSGTGPSNRGG